MNDSRVVTVLKHWPGHGSARNSHTGPASVPPLATLERHPNRAIAKIRDAIASGALRRDQAVASARRIVALKSSYGLAPR
jgi:beta-glucosidase-like glycosyl hydrolase